MSHPEKTVLVTGVAGNLGVRFLREVPEFEVLGLDMKPPATGRRLRFEAVDLGQEASCRRIIDLLRESRAASVVHLAFVIDPVRTGVLDVARMWRINVAGTARVMEAISVVNRTGGAVRRFVFISSVSAYGSDLPRPVTEDFPLGGHSLPYAVHKRESDQVVQERAESLGACSTYILRPHIFAGATMQNYLINILRGTPYGTGRLGRLCQRRGRHLPAILPFGEKYLETRFQYVHVDDMARLLAWILRRPEPSPGTFILNVAGRGEALSFRRCAQIAGTGVMRMPGKWGCRLALSLAWKLGISCVPAEAVPYFTGTYLMDTTRLRQFLGKDYEDVIRHTCEQAFADSFIAPAPAEPSPSLEQTAKSSS